MKKKVLLLNSEPEYLGDIKEGLALSSYELADVCSELSEINRKAITNKIDIVMVVTEKKFDQLFVCVQQLHLIKPIPTVVFTYEDDRKVIQEAIKAGVSAYIVDGLNPKRIATILDTAMIRFNEQMALRKELERTKNTLGERKLIERAKGIVMQRSDIDEAEAYKSMRKMAMDKNIKMAELAKSVISAAELMS